MEDVNGTSLFEQHLLELLARRSKNWKSRIKMRLYVENNERYLLEKENSLFFWKSVYHTCKEQADHEARSTVSLSEGNNIESIVGRNEE